MEKDEKKRKREKEKTVSVLQMYIYYADNRGAKTRSVTTHRFKMFKCDT